MEDEPSFPRMIQRPIALMDTEECLCLDLVAEAVHSDSLRAAFQPFICSVEHRQMLLSSRFRVK